MLCCSRCSWPWLGGFSLGTAIRATFRWAVVWRLSEHTVQAQRTPLAPLTPLSPSCGSLREGRQHSRSWLKGSELPAHVTLSDLWSLTHHFHLLIGGGSQAQLRDWVFGQHPAPGEEHRPHGHVMFGHLVSAVPRVMPSFISKKVSSCL